MLHYTFFFNDKLQDGAQLVKTQGQLEQIVLSEIKTTLYAVSCIIYISEDFTNHLVSEV